jgi:arylsulfatase A-like enzyme
MKTHRLARVAVGLLLVALGAMLVTKALEIGAIDPARADRRANHVATDLLDDWRRALVLADTRTIEFGAPGSKAHYHEPDPRLHRAANGILSRDFGNGTTAGFACGDRVHVRFVRLGDGPARVALVAVGIPADERSGQPARDQTVEVRIRGEAAAIATLPLPGSATPTRLEFEIPRSRLVRGENELEFRFATTVERTFEGYPGALRYAATFVRLEFDSGAPSPPSAELDLEEVAGLGSGPARRALVFREGTRLVLPVRLGAGRPRFVATIHVHPDDSADREPVLFARYRTVGDAMQTIVRSPLDARTRNPRDRAAVAVDVDLSTYAGTRGVLEFETPEAPPGANPLRIALVAPMIRGGETRTREADPHRDLAGLRNALTGSNVVLLLLDAAGAKHFSAYGAAKEATPHLAALARDGIVFERTTSPSSYTLPAIGSLFTGLHPHTHGVVDNGSETTRRRLATSTRTFAEWLKAKGYRTFGFVSNPNGGPEPGYDRGFDVYERLYDDPALWNEGVAPEALNDAVLRRVAAGEVKEPFFLYAHYFPPHAPYRAPERYHEGIVDPGYTGGTDGSRATIEAFRHRGEPYTERDLARLEQLYRANLRYVDDQANRLLHALEAAGLAERTTFVVVADHGEAFGEHANFEHGDTTFAEEIEVPWFVRFPIGVPFPPTRVPGPCSLVDVAPTLLSLLSVDARDFEFDGHDLAGRLFVRSIPIEPPERPIVARSAGFEARWNVRAGGFSYHEDVWTRERRLYDLIADPTESSPVPVVRNPLAEELRAQLCRFLCGGTKAGETFVPEQDDLSKAIQTGYLQRDPRAVGASAHRPDCPLLRR